MELQPETKLELIFKNINFSELAKNIAPKSNRDPNGYNPIPIIRVLLAQQIKKIPTKVNLVRN